VMPERTEAVDLSMEAARLIREINEGSQFIESRWDMFELDAARARYHAVKQGVRSLAWISAALASAGLIGVVAVAHAIASENGGLPVSVAIAVPTTIALIAAAIGAGLRSRSSRAGLTTLALRAAELERRLELSTTA
jgi:hypothetical protein